ncbi:MAG: hypothetical protein KGJ90_00190 [Patescibacteria group bacterium]|nr:hypothetical protein [Patescibacteria group bacterium]
MVQWRPTSIITPARTIAANQRIHANQSIARERFPDIGIEKRIEMSTTVTAQERSAMNVLAKVADLLGALIINRAPNKDFWDTVLEAERIARDESMKIARKIADVKMKRKD